MKWFWPATDVIAAILVVAGDMPIWWLQFLALLFFIGNFIGHIRDAVGQVVKTEGLT